jgi:uncharacterized cofD-like protein
MTNDNDIKVVAIGGGTGLPTLLSGLKNYTADITAIVTVSDDGGGSGVLREELGIVPPGDIRNCILSLANRDPIMTDLLRYRFSEGILKGQNFGNLLIAAMVGISDSFEEAVFKVSEMFAITGKVLPVSTENIKLVAKLKNEKMIVGESKIPYGALKYRSPIDVISMMPPDPCAMEGVVGEIDAADIIVLGPGSLYTSVIPNILIRSVDDAIAKSSAPKVFICNIMTQPGETDGMSVGDHVRAFYKHSAHRYIDYVVVNDYKFDKDVLEKYASKNACPISLTENDLEYLSDENIGIVLGDYAQTCHGHLRHDSDKLSRDIIYRFEKIKK